MGIIISRFRKKQTTEEVLDGIDKRVTELQKFRWRNQQLKKQYIGSLILYSIIIYILAALVFYFYYLPELWRDRFLYSTPLLIFPILVWLFKKFLHWYFIKRIAQNDIELQEIRSKKKQILEEVMEKETYKKAKEILEKYDPERFKKVEKPVVVSPKLFVTPSSAGGLRQRNLGSRGPTPQSMPGRGRGLTPGTTPRLPQGRGTPMQPRQILSVGRNGQPMMSPYNQAPGPPLPRPIIPRERGKMDKLVEYFVGDGPQNRYALVCRYCHSHNGMALKEEFEYLTFRCCYCYQLNPARKQKPFAPKIDFAAARTSTPLPPRSQEGVGNKGLPIAAIGAIKKPGNTESTQIEDDDDEYSDGDESDDEGEDSEEEDMEVEESATKSTYKGSVKNTELPPMSEENKGTPDGTLMETTNQNPTHSEELVEKLVSKLPNSGLDSKTNGHGVENDHNAVETLGHSSHQVNGHSNGLEKTES